MIVDIAQLKKRERDKLAKKALGYGNRTKVAEEIGVNPKTIDRAIAGERISPYSLNAIRKYLQNA